MTTMFNPLYNAFVGQIHYTDLTPEQTERGITAETLYEQAYQNMAEHLEENIGELSTTNTQTLYRCGQRADRISWSSSILSALGFLLSGDSIFTYEDNKPVVHIDKELTRENEVLIPRSSFTTYNDLGAHIPLSGLSGYFAQVGELLDDEETAEMNAIFDQCAIDGDYNGFVLEAITYVGELGSEGWDYVRLKYDGAMQFMGACDEDIGDPEELSLYDMWINLNGFYKNSYDPALDLEEQADKFALALETACNAF